MNIEHFIALSNSDQLKTVLEVGIYMSSYTEENLVFDIYQLDDIFVKIIYDVDKKVKPWITPFTDLDFM